jgi:beta-galactosidase
MIRTFIFLFLAALASCKGTEISKKQWSPREEILFNDEWRFSLAADSTAIFPSYDDTAWRTLTLPHDWSIEGKFSESHPAGVGGGALPGGTGWYRKKFIVSSGDKGRKLFIRFDGVYCNSDVWVNGKHLGNRPNGYISFQYDLTPHLRFGEVNLIAVRVDNSKQPNSRWYSGSGIYRNVWFVKTGEVHVIENGTFVTTPHVNDKEAEVRIETIIKNTTQNTAEVTLETSIVNAAGEAVSSASTKTSINAGAVVTLNQNNTVNSPELWSIERPYLYKVVSKLLVNGEATDHYTTSFGIRSFSFDADKGFSLNGKEMKILGVCNHHDLGALGAAVNTRAIERQLEILKRMGVNGIRTSHNPPAPELLDLCDRMGFVVMDEVFDMWKKKKSEYDYSTHWDQWHKQDLEDFIRRDRNHPSVIIWSIGNEIGEQWDSTGTVIAKELAGIVRSLDTTRPITTGNNEAKPDNWIIRSGVLDLIGYNYNHKDYSDFHQRYPGKKFIATETTSALATRGHYDMPSDSIRRWPIAWDKLFTEGNKDNTVSAYDNVSAPWGSTHEETWKVMKKHPHLSGMFIWTGFDYLGEPTPYVWPSRSSYFGVVDLAGFPKDSYYMYQSEWTRDDVLHIFPHWNWKEGQTIDMWAYYNNADVAELFLNGVSQGVRTKHGDDLHVMWRLKYTPGTVKVVTRRNGKEVLSREVKTAGAAYRIELQPDRILVNADGKDLSFITAKVLDKDGNMVPYADNEITFDVSGAGTIAALDNGDPTSHESFQDTKRKAFNGLALCIVKTTKTAGQIQIKASSPGLQEAIVTVRTK